MRHHDDRRQGCVRTAARVLLGLAVLGLAGCDQDNGNVSGDTAAQIDEGRQIFRFDTFGDEAQWTDRLRMHEVIQSAVDPVTALSVGLKVDSEALPAGVLQTADLRSPATTVALIKLNAVVGFFCTVLS
jgi:hypothetical protein